MTYKDFIRPIQRGGAVATLVVVLLFVLGLLLDAPADLLAVGAITVLVGFLTYIYRWILRYRVWRKERTVANTSTG